MHTETEPPVNILFVEDNHTDVALLRDIFTQVDAFCYELTNIGRLQDVASALAADHFDVILLDHNLPDSHGMETVNRVSAIAPKVPIIVLTDLDDEAFSIDVVHQGVQDYLVKSLLDARSVVRSIKYAIERNQLRLQLMQANDEKQFLATHDNLTGIPNRQLFLDRLEQALARLERYKEQFALLLLDIDRFRSINDHFGQAVGDRILVTVGKRLQAVLRKTDTVARIGGDQFAVIISGLSKPKHITTVAEKILSSQFDNIALSDHDIMINCSVGVVVAPYNGEQTEILLKRADAALMRAKNAGGGRYHFFDKSFLG